MAAINEALIPVLTSAITRSLENFESTGNGNSLSDLYLKFSAADASLAIYDDIENKLCEISLEELDEYALNLEKQLTDAFRHILRKMENEGVFEREYIFKPFAVSLVDEDFIVSEELIFIDDDTLKIDGILMSDLDKELDDFLRDLMK